jgi:hypothetical protein
MLVRGRAPRHRGVFVGEVVEVRSSGGGRGGRGGKGGRGSRGSRGGKGGGNKKNSGDDAVVVALQTGLKRGDGLVFDASTPATKEEGGSVFELFRAGSALTSAEAGDLVEVRFGDGRVDMGRIRVGDKIWKNSDPTLMALLRDPPPADVKVAAAAVGARGKTSVRARVSGSVGLPITVTLEAETSCAGSETIGVVCGVGESDAELSVARSQPIDEPTLRSAIGAMGGTPLHLDGEVAMEQLDGGLFVPTGALKEARRRAAIQLVDALHEAAIASFAADGVAERLRQEARANATEASKGSGQLNDTASSTTTTDTVTLSLLCRTAEQASAAAELPPVLLHTPEHTTTSGNITPAREVRLEIVLDFLEVQGLRKVAKALQSDGHRVVLATPRIVKPGEERVLAFFLGTPCDALLVRSVGMLQRLAELGGTGGSVLVGRRDEGKEGTDLLQPMPPPQGTLLRNSSQDDMGGEDGGEDVRRKAGGGSSRRNRQKQVTIPALHGDFSLNAANSITASVLFKAGGLSRLAPTHDLDAAQICELAHALAIESNDAGNGGTVAPAVAPIEAVCHQHMPIFHTEHCVFARFLSDGDSYKDCGQPCEHTRVHLRDGKSQDHLVLADMGCRNTVFEARAQTAAPYLDDMLSAGIRAFRVELIDESASSVVPLVEKYAAALVGGLNPDVLQEHLSKITDANGTAHGVTLGSLESRRKWTPSRMSEATRKAKSALAGSPQQQ